MRIKVFGERNTATNAVEQLIQNNSHSYISPGTEHGLNTTLVAISKNLRRVRMPRAVSEAVLDNIFRDVAPDRQWKHTATYFPSVESLAYFHVIFTVRHPLSWLLSFHRNPYHALNRRPDDFLEFYKKTWPTLARDRLCKLALRPLELLEAKIESYFFLAEKLDTMGISYSFVRQEDLVMNQREVFEKIKPWLDAPNDTFSELRQSTKHRVDIEFYRRYYGDEQWRASIPSEIKENYVFCRRIMSRFDYAF
tara:strand:+ start:345 stop:1097 length:753 start_codon:yes stop_codon:yes gene_type:complete